MPSVESTRFSRSAWWWTITLGVSMISTPWAGSGSGSRPRRFAKARRVEATVGTGSTVGGPGCWCEAGTWSSVLGRAASFSGRVREFARRAAPPRRPEKLRAGLGRADAGFRGSDMPAILGCDPPRRALTRCRERSASAAAAGRSRRRRPRRARCERRPMAWCGVVGGSTPRRPRPSRRSRGTARSPGTGGRRRAAVRSRRLPPVPGLRAVPRERRDGRGLRGVLPPTTPHHAIGRRSHRARRGRLRRLRPAAAALAERSRHRVSARRGGSQPRIAGMSEPRKPASARPKPARSFSGRLGGAARRANSRTRPENDAARPSTEDQVPASHQQPGPPTVLPVPTVASTRRAFAKRLGLDPEPDPAHGVEIIDTPSVMVHHQADLLNLVLSTLGIGVMILLAIYAHGTTQGVTQDVRGVSTLLRNILLVPANVLEGLLTIAVPILVLTELAIRRLGQDQDRDG